ncbi:hypothetical protein [Candidatus Aalborgicola defluviihabitans]|jgi:hypothetical protein|uniref:hypothetical protein n=1 Tax=Candidatus Aalborgicola defluviihabitans TaxID=3386187 RepID=UPI001DDDED2E|nr:hypothetical protein [Burkholderiales bacterium]MBL0242602.1 hypothetical protein [Rhodoferax sp.]MBK6570148.1 hypothetical protein [Burkholderiales bacterium]MBK7281889.1 hypothetical protein [Burkholderiales bacterium]MBK7314965.1 hypothetical protein [Burkholderiales bacterium]
MSAYPLLEHEGRCASISTQREPTGRWIAWVSFERDPDFARLKAHAGNPHRVHNDYPSEEKAVTAAYDFARELIAQESASN